MAIREDIKLQVQAATDIVRLIGEQVSLRPKGREFVGLCPFHDDKNPSFSVSPAKQIYKCFSCGAGGDVFSFQMNYHKMTFPEALKHLAERAGIQIEDARSEAASAAGRSDRERLNLANDQALNYFRGMLKHSEYGRPARDYIEKRGISPQMVTEFQIGYAADRWDGLIETAKHKGWNLDALVRAELVLPRKQGEGHFDFFRHRLIFPIFDTLGRPIAFGGRKLRPEDEPKYINSRETAVFNKSRTFYGLHLAKKPIIDARTAVIVEGYTDVIACHQAGFRNVVATLGTALTAEHVAELRKFADKVVCIFDADEAGEKAADRAVELFLTGDVDVAVAVLPHGPGGSKMDPGELFTLEEGPDVWRKCIAEARDALDYQFDRVRERLAAAGTMTGRQKVSQDYLQRIAALGFARSGTIRRGLVIQRLAELLHLKESQIEDLLRQAAPRFRSPIAHAGVPEGPSQPFEGGESAPDANNEAMDVAGAVAGARLRAVHQAEREVIGCLLRDNRLFLQVVSDGRTFDEAIAPGDILGRQNRRLYEPLYDRLAAGEGVELRGLLADLAAAGEQELANLATEAEAAVERAAGDEPDRMRSVFVGAAEAILNYRRELEYQTNRESVAGVGNLADDGLAERANRLLEPLRNRSPVRIARVRR